MLRWWADMLRGWSGEQGSKNWRAAAGAKGERHKLNAGGQRMLLFICLDWSLLSVGPKWPRPTFVAIESIKH